MNTVNGQGKTGATATRYVVLLLTILLSVEVLAACQPGDFGQSGMVSAASNAASVAHREVVRRWNALDVAISHVLAELKYACTLGLAF